MPDSRKPEQSTMREWTKVIPYPVTLGAHPDPLKRNPDSCYLFVACSGCGQRWQSIDWGCARHLLTCDPTPPQPQDPSAWSVES